MTNGKIAIHMNEKIFKHSGDWGPQFVSACERLGLAYEIVDCYQNGFIDRLGEYGYLIFPLQNYCLADKMEAAKILEAARIRGVATFPDHGTLWHFDDKIAETYAFQAIAAPIPGSHVFYLLSECLAWLRDFAAYPLVAKLRCGSGSNGVRLLKNKAEAQRYARRMFARGYDAAPSLAYKAYSNAQSAKDWAMAWARIKRIPEFLRTRRHGRMLPRERGYCYFQEYIPNDGYSMKLYVVGDKLTFYTVAVRKWDFRASGGEGYSYDRQLVTKPLIDSAFAAADGLKAQCMGFDYVVNKETGEGLIIEMCYATTLRLLAPAGGYFDRDGAWHEGEFDVPEEIVRNLARRGTGE